MNFLHECSCLRLIVFFRVLEDELKEKVSLRSTQHTPALTCLEEENGIATPGCQCADEPWINAL
jgi:hypothetical protein